MFLRTALFVAIFSVATSGCSERAVAPPPDTSSPFPDLGIVASNYPKVDGSTSAEPLQRLIACKVLGTDYVWFHSASDDTRRLFASDESGIVPHPARARDGKRQLRAYINYITEHQGTHKAYVNLISQRVDMILVARKPSKDELRLASRREVELEVQPAALDAFVFLLHETNPVNSLTAEQIRDIYSGRSTNWRQVGGWDDEITPFQRNRNSGSQEVMRALVMKDREMTKSPEMLTGTKMGFPSLALTHSPSGIGYTFCYYHEFMVPAREVKVCAVEDVSPTPETVASGRYPFVTEVYIVLRRDTPSTHPAWRLRAWLLTPTGQRIVQQSGYVSIDESIAEDHDFNKRRSHWPAWFEGNL